MPTGSFLVGSVGPRVSVLYEIKTFTHTHLQYTNMEMSLTYCALTNVLVLEGKDITTITISDMELQHPPVTQGSWQQLMLTCQWMLTYHR